MLGDPAPRAGQTQSGRTRKGRQSEAITFSFGVLRHQPVMPAAVAFCCVKLRKLTPSSGSQSVTCARLLAFPSAGGFWRVRTLDLAVDEEVDLKESGQSGVSAM